MYNQVRPINKSFCLQTLCEENFEKLFRLIPNIELGNAINHHVHVQILETGPFTYTILLRNKEFSNTAAHPCFKCRVYLDTKAIEVISIKGGALALVQHPTPRDTLNQKWAINYFLEKWLTFQLQTSHSEEASFKAVNA